MKLNIGWSCSTSRIIWMINNMNPYIMIVEK